MAQTLSEISANKLKKIPYGTMRPQTCTPAPLAACLVCCTQGDSLVGESWHLPLMQREY